MKKLRIVFMVLFSVILIPVQPDLSAMDQSDAESTVKIAVAAESSTESSKISDTAGRAPFFLIFDGNGAFIKTIKNPAQYQQGGASSSVTALLKKELVKILIAVEFGAKMENNLKAAGIEYRKHTGIAKEVVETLINNMPNEDAHN